MTFIHTFILPIKLNFYTSRNKKIHCRKRGKKALFLTSMKNLMKHCLPKQCTTFFTLFLCLRRDCIFSSLIFIPFFILSVLLFFFLRPFSRFCQETQEVYFFHPKGLVILLTFLSCSTRAMTFFLFFLVCFILFIVFEKSYHSHLKGHHDNLQLFKLLSMTDITEPLRM